MTDDPITIDLAAARIVTKCRCAACAEEGTGNGRLVATIRATAAGGIVIPHHSHRHYDRTRYTPAELDLEDALEKAGELDTVAERAKDATAYLLEQPVEPLVVCKRHGRLDAPLDLLSAAYRERRPTITLTPRNEG